MMPPKFRRHFFFLNLLKKNWQLTSLGVFNLLTSQGSYVQLHWRQFIPIFSGLRSTFYHWGTFIETKNLEYLHFF